MKHAFTTQAAAQIAETVSAVKPKRKHPCQNLIGQEFTWLKVIAFEGYRGSGKKVPYYKCICKCEKEVTVRYSALTCGDNKSCGCRRKLLTGPRSTTHGHHRLKQNGGRSREYQSWDGMIARCNNPSRDVFKHYGGRGIKICAGMTAFEGFLAILGQRPEGTTLDRRNNDANYSCGKCQECVINGWEMNVRWVSQKTQMNNTRRNTLLTYLDKTMTMKQWAEELNLNYSLLVGRINKYGWSTERALTTPVNIKCRKLS